MRLDGCAIYYRRDVLSLIEHVDVEFLQPNVTLLNRDNVAIVARFAPRDNPTAEFVVATTHLLYNPRRQDVRLAQTQVLLSEIERIAYKRQPDRNYLPVILTGDFNASPDSAVYELIRYGAVEYQHLTPKTLQRTDSFHRTGKLLIPPTLRINGRAGGAVEGAFIFGCFARFLPARGRDQEEEQRHAADEGGRAQAAQFVSQ